MDKVVCFPRTETPLRLFCLCWGEPGSETRDVCDVTRREAEQLNVSVIACATISGHILFLCRM